MGFFREKLWSVIKKIYLSSRENWLSSRENWLSPVFQATVLGRLELWDGWRWKTSAPLAGGFLWLQYGCIALEQFTEEVKPPMTRGRPAYPLQRQTGPEFEFQLDPVLIIILYFKCRNTSKIYLEFLNKSVYYTNFFTTFLYWTFLCGLFIHNFIILDFL